MCVTNAVKNIINGKKYSVMNLDKVEDLVETLKEHHLESLEGGALNVQKVASKQWDELERQLKGTGKHWTFHVEMESRNQQRSGNIETAFEEFFDAHIEWARKKPDAYRVKDEVEKMWHDANPEPGTRDNPFEASNGIKIYYV